MDIESTPLKLSHSMTHYLLVIHKLKEQKGYARITDISKELDITKGSVSTAVNNLKKRELIKEEDGTKFLALTEQGHDSVHNILSNRNLLYHFFSEVLGVSEENARQGACDMEHLIGEEIRKEFFDFMKTISQPAKNKNKSTLISKLKSFETKLDLLQYTSIEDFVKQQGSDY